MMTSCMKSVWPLLYLLPLYLLGNKPLDVTAVCPNTQAPQGCLKDFQGSCYVPHKKLLDWNGAVEFCCKTGGFLAKLYGETTQDLRNLYVRIFESLSMECGWVGMSDSVAEGYWHWTDGSDVVDPQWEIAVISRWFAGSYDCAVFCQKSMPFLLLGGIWKLSKRKCAEKNYFICQFADRRPTSEGTSVTQDESHDNVSIQRKVTTSALLLQSSTIQVHQIATEAPKKKKPKHDSSRKRERLMKKISDGIFVSGNILFDTRAFTVSMCARACLNNIACIALNYNQVTQRCVGIHSEMVTRQKRDRQWQLWHVY